MSGMRRNQSGYMPGSSRPNLTLDTESSTPKKPTDGACVQSAPVGTRQDKGLAPMYQAGDQHIAKMAEMMESPTWRGQNPGPHVRQQASSLRYLQTPSFDREKNVGYKSNNKALKGATHTSMVAVLAPEEYHGRQFTSDQIRLSRDADDIKVQGIHPCPKNLAPDNTFLISAKVSPQQLLLEKMQGLRLEDSQMVEFNSQDLSGSRREIQHGQQLPMNDCSSGALENNLEHGKKRFPVATIKNVHDVDKKRFSIGPLKNGQEQAQNRKHEAKAMGRKKANQPTGYGKRSSMPQRVESEEQKRFDELMTRLVPQKTTELVDPAIVAFAPKKTGQAYLPKNGDRERSDSGYITPSAYSRPGTGAQSKPSGKPTVGAGTNAVHDGHGKEGSNDSGFVDSASKNTSLNPAAKEFAISTSSTTPSKTIVPSRPRVFSPTMQPMQSTQAVQPYPPAYSNPAMPATSQQLQGMLPALPLAQMGPMQSAQGAWFPPQFSQFAQPPQTINNSMMALAPMQQGGVPGMQSQWSNFGGSAMQPTAGVNTMGPNTMGPNTMGSNMGMNNMGMHNMGMHNMGMHNMGMNNMGMNNMGMNHMGMNNMGSNHMGLNHMGFNSTALGSQTGTAPRLAQSGGLGAPGGGPPGPRASTNAFHQQLPSLGQYCNPTHHAMNTFVPAQAGPRTSVMAPQATMGALAPMAAPFVPRHVPKPKVPDTQAQMQWELDHELRRMNEPGYAQKCKEKQKKRYLRQLDQRNEKNGHGKKTGQF